MTYILRSNKEKLRKIYLEVYKEIENEEYIYIPKLETIIRKKLKENKIYSPLNVKYIFGFFRKNKAIVPDITGAFKLKKVK